MTTAAMKETKTTAPTPGERGPLLLGPHSGLEEEVEVVVGVRLRAVSSQAWESLWIVRPSEMEAPFIGWVGEMVRTEARVVAIPTLLNEFARAWYFCLTKGSGMGSPQERHIAGLILWIMRRLAADVRKHGYRARWMLTVEEVPNLVYLGFCKPFVAEYGEVLPLFEVGGISQFDLLAFTQQQGIKI
ncbi:hypothetical protein B0J18DRAFT_433878 [Chaetomium sp. MPI-SDFR-AT-0129]|nr:hypothetical protein B0J18DRAFT_433878 [Chaetomium sp. MPI-SDFR-AT-0129]